MLCKDSFKILYSFHSFQHSFNLHSAAVSYGAGIEEELVLLVSLTENAGILNRFPCTGHPLATIFGTQITFSALQTQGTSQYTVDSVPFRKTTEHGQKRWIRVAFVNCFASSPKTFEMF